MVSWESYYCTDCGKPMSSPGTCNDCKIANQRAETKIREDLKKTDKKGRK
jgi:hypothetical protein